MRIHLRSSRIFALILATAHGAAIAAVLLSDMPIASRSVAAAVLAMCGVMCVRRYALMLAADAAVEIEIGSDNRLLARSRHGEWSECEVLGSTCVTNFLTVLNLRRIVDHAKWCIVILPDGIEAGDFRKLRVWLRWKRAPAS